MKKFISICKKVGKVAWFILGVIGAIFIACKLRKTILGKVKRREETAFRDVPGDPGKIRIIKKDGSTEVLELPEGIKYKDVVAAGVSETNKITVEVLHEKNNRRDLGPVLDDNALDAVRSRTRPSDTNGSDPMDGNSIAR